MDPNTRTLRVAAVASYVLASVTLGAGLLLTITLVTGAARVPNQLDTFRFLGLAPLANLLARQLQAALTTAGVAIFIVTVILSALLYALGTLFGYIRKLSLRVATLEAQGPPQLPARLP
jgi:hypothetical protein